MKVIDLSQEIYGGMSVYPGDPEVRVKKIHTIAKEGWDLREMTMTTHVGSHVDAPSHMDASGKSLSELPIDRFMGKARVVDLKALSSKSEALKGLGLVVVGPSAGSTGSLQAGSGSSKELDVDLFDEVMELEPRFVCVGTGKKGASSMSVEMERKLLEAGIITYTDLVNLDKLPKDKCFMFYGVPLNIKDGDGSPVRAFAIVD